MTPSQSRAWTRAVESLRDLFGDEVEIYAAQGTTTGQVPVFAIVVGAKGAPLEARETFAEGLRREIVK